MLAFSWYILALQMQSIPQFSEEAKDEIFAHFELKSYAAACCLSQIM